jgi:hypothetical protein
MAAFCWMYSCFTDLKKCGLRAIETEKRCQGALRETHGVLILIKVKDWNWTFSRRKISRKDGNDE